MALKNDNSCKNGTAEFRTIETSEIRYHGTGNHPNQQWFVSKGRLDANWSNGEYYVTIRYKDGSLRNTDTIQWSGGNTSG